MGIPHLFMTLKYLSEQTGNSSSTFHYFNECTVKSSFLLIPFFPGIKYDAEKEEKQLQEARQRELQRIEETKLKAAEQGQGSALISRQLVCVCVCV